MWTEAIVVKCGKALLQSDAPILTIIGKLWN